MVVNAVVALALYKPFGIAGIVIGTVAGTLVMTVAQGWILRGELRRDRGRAGRSRRLLRMLAAAALLAAVSYFAWSGSTSGWARVSSRRSRPSGRRSSRAWGHTR